MNFQTIRLRLKRNSLFFKLLTGFISLIALLLSFNFFSFTIFSNDVQREMIRSNSLSLSNAVERYENHLKIIQNTILHFYFSDKVVLLNEFGNSSQFDPVNQVVEEVKTIADNELLFVDNILLQFHKNDYIIDKNGPSTTDQFATRYFSKDYWPDFWRDQLNQGYVMKVLPQSDFTNRNTGTSTSLIPVVFKNKVLDQFFVVAFLNSEKLMHAFHNSDQNQFYLLDSNNRQIFRSSGAPSDLHAELQAAMTDGKDYVKRDSIYYFYKKGAFSGLTYLNVVPYDKLSEDKRRLNLILLTMLGVALIISILMSVVLSLKFNSPVKKIVEAINRFGPGSPLQSNIDEYNLIYDKIKHFIQSDRDIRDDHKRNAAQLQYFRYMCKMKNIHSHEKELQDDEKPFYLILFHLTKTESFHRLHAEEQKRAMYFIKEFIDIALNDHFADPVTMQMEKDQIISLIFRETEEKDLLATVRRLQHVFDQDKEYCRLTIAVNPVLRKPSEFTDAYDEALEMINRRKMTNGTQIISRLLPEPLVIGFTSEHERALVAGLQIGAKENAMAMVTAQLNHMEKIGATARQFDDFARRIVTAVMKFLLSANQEISQLIDKRSPFARMANCFSIPDYIELFESFFAEAAALIPGTSEDQDPAKSMLLQYVNQNYHREISLENVAEELGLSHHYISKYFKEKTGTNFLDYVTGLRIDKAKELLLNTTLKTQEISEQVGYINTNSFIRMFRKATGVSPGEYRKTTRFLKNRSDLPMG